MVTDEQFQDLKGEFGGLRGEFDLLRSDMKGVEFGILKLGVYFERLLERLDAEREQFTHLVTKVDRIDENVEMLKVDVSALKVDMKIVKEHLELS